MPSYYSPTKKPPGDPEGAERVGAGPQTAASPPPAGGFIGRAINQTQGLVSDVDKAANQIANVGQQAPNAPPLQGFNLGSGGTLQDQAQAAYPAGSSAPATPAEEPPLPILGPDPGVLQQYQETGASRIPHLDANQQFAQQNQDQLTAMLTQQALGLGPTQASALAQQNNDRQLRQMQAQGAMGGALGLQQAQFQAPQLMAQQTQDATMLAAQEQQNARQLLGDTLATERDQSLRWDQTAMGGIQDSAEFNNMVTEQYAKGWETAAGEVLTEQQIALIIQEAIQEQSRFTTEANLAVARYNADNVPREGERSFTEEIAPLGEAALKGYAAVQTGGASLAAEGAIGALTPEQEEEERRKRSLNKNRRGDA